MAVPTTSEMLKEAIRRWNADHGDAIDNAFQFAKAVKDDKGKPLFPGSSIYRVEDNSAGPDLIFKVAVLAGYSQSDAALISRGLEPSGSRETIVDRMVDLIMQLPESDREVIENLIQSMAKKKRINGDSHGKLLPSR